MQKKLLLKKILKKEKKRKGMTLTACIWYESSTNSGKRKITVHLITCRLLLCRDFC